MLEHIAAKLTTYRPEPWPCLLACLLRDWFTSVNFRSVRRWVEGLLRETQKHDMLTIHLQKYARVLSLLARFWDASLIVGTRLRSTDLIAAYSCRLLFHHISKLSSWQHQKAATQGQLPSLSESCMPCRDSTHDPEFDPAVSSFGPQIWNTWLYLTTYFIICILLSVI